MRTLNLALTLLLTASAAHADGDKIGNGGGLWTCWQGSELMKAELVDLFEARTEFQLAIPTNFTGTTPSEIYREKKEWLAEQLPELYKALAPHFQYVESHLLTVDGELALISRDSLYRVIPSGDGCPNGRWEYTQFANFTLYGNLLIRKSMWESARVPALDKAALLVHETIYKWMRNKYGDNDSVRTRQIVGLLFSNLGSADISSRIATILKNSPLGAPPSNPSSEWLCVLEESNGHNIFIGRGFAQIEAEINVISACQQRHLNEYCMSEPKCERNGEQKKTCYLRDENSHELFYGQGFSLLEATARARISCETRKANEYCYKAPVKCD